MLAGRPHRILLQAINALEMEDIDVFSRSRIIETAPLGPSQRRYANAAALIATALEPVALLERLGCIERHFGRKSSGQRWRARPLDLDIILWSGGVWESAAPDLAIPHPAFRDRAFVLAPAVEIAADLRDPLSGLTLRQLFHRLNRPKPLDRPRAPH
ncbi:2-amino-4-hydroxy-6-hydroxymethyldihydropteridine diphosphokinase [Sphingorhabdus sp.]|uniref:2-amino-4-hydroxy-6- hydroxymethyldihydropteridine diphosphokinase n=1 Tax=Sphingorhabdus sp. TaxID=1902408 RepID=UPI0035B3E0C0